MGTIYVIGCEKCREDVTFLRNGTSGFSGAGFFDHDGPKFMAKHAEHAQQLRIYSEHDPRFLEFTSFGEAPEPPAKSLYLEPLLPGAPERKNDLGMKLVGAQDRALREMVEARLGPITDGEALRGRLHKVKRDEGPWHLTLDGALIGQMSDPVILSEWDTAVATFTYCLVNAAGESGELQTARVSTP